MAGSDPLSVLVVDEDASNPRISGASSRRQRDTRVARTQRRRGVEGIAQRSYIPINLILTDVTVREAVNDPGVGKRRGAACVSRLRQIRPEARVLYMSAYTDAGMIRIQLDEPAGGILRATI